MMADQVFEAFDRVVEEPETSWNELAHQEFPESPDQRSELLKLLTAWKSKPDFRVRTEDIQEALRGIELASKVDLPQPEIETVTILHELGSGGSATVYLGRQDAPVERKVAVKVFYPQASRASHLQREATALARLNHPNIATLYAVGR